MVGELPAGENFVQPPSSNRRAGCDGGHSVALGQLSRLQGEVQGSACLPGIDTASAGAMIICLLVCGLICGKGLPSISQLMGSTFLDLQVANVPDSIPSSSKRGLMKALVLLGSGQEDKATRESYWGQVGDLCSDSN